MSTIPTPGLTKPNTALVGALQAGKDSVAGFLVRYFHYQRVSFADNLKREVCLVLNAANPFIPDGSPFWTPELIDKHKEFVRPLLLWYGTEYRRHQNDFYWVDQVHHQIARANQGGIPVVCTDGRFTNELALLDNYGCTIIELDMPQEEVVKRLRKKGMSDTEIDQRLTHTSEREWRSWPKDAVLPSHVGNLPVLIKQTLGVLGLMAPMSSIMAYLQEALPSTYGNFAWVEAHAEQLGAIS